MNTANKTTFLQTKKQTLLIINLQHYEFMINSYANAHLMLNHRLLFYA